MFRGGSTHPKNDPRIIDYEIGGKGDLDPCLPVVFFSFSLVQFNILLFGEIKRPYFIRRRVHDTNVVVDNVINVVISIRSFVYCFIQLSNFYCTFQPKGASFTTNLMSPMGVVKH
jgi:hypothetical protein